MDRNKRCIVPSKKEPDHDDIGVYRIIGLGQMSIGIVAESVFNKISSPFEADPSCKNKKIVSPLFFEVHGGMSPATPQVKE